jgi:O-antigen/teichoic acid export membrane protein
MLGTQTLVGVVHRGPFGLLLGDAVGRMNGSLGLARLSWNRGREVFRLIRWKTMWSAATRYRRFPLISTGSSLISAAGYALPLLVLGEFYGARTLGWLALGDRVLGAPGLLIGQAVSQVYSVEAASFSNSNPEAMRGLFLRLMKRLVPLGFIPFVIFFFFSPSLFAFVFGEAWREAGVYARLLALMHYVAFVAWPFTPTLNLLEQQFWQLAWDVGRLLLALGSIWFAHHWGYPARWAIGAFGAALLFAYAVHLLLCHYAITRKIWQFRISGPSPVAAHQRSEIATPTGSIE